MEVESLRSAVAYAAPAVADDSDEVPVLASLVKAYASEGIRAPGGGVAGSPPSVPPCRSSMVVRSLLPWRQCPHGHVVR